MRKILQLAEEHELTLPQLVLLYLMSNKDITTFKTYKDICNSVGVPHISEEEKEYLCKKKYLVRKKGNIKLNTDKDIFAEEEEEVTEETIYNTIYNAYPDFAKSSKGSNMFLKKVSYSTTKALITKHVKDKVEMREVLKDIEYGIANDLINVRIDRYFLYMKDAIRSERLESTTNITNVERDF